MGTVFGWLHSTAWIAFIAAGITAAIRFRYKGRSQA
jgi:hypothetical protein